MIKYQIFLSSCFDPNMQKNRELFIVAQLSRQKSKIFIMN